MEQAIVDALPCEELVGYMRMMMALRQEHLAKCQPPPGFKYTCLDEFILKEGRPWRPAPLPPDVRPRMPKMCFCNATKLAKSRSDLTYVEGYAYGMIIPTIHAWCVDRQGNVVDPTWHGDLGPGSEYYGVAFSINYVLKEHRKNKIYGVLDDWHNGWPLLKGANGWRPR